MLSTLPAALAEQVSAEPDGAAGSSGHCLRVASMAMGQDRARGSGSNRAVTTGTSGHDRAGRSGGFRRALLRRIRAVVATPRSRGVAMGRPRGWAAERTGRPVMRSPGRPPAVAPGASGAVLDRDRRGTFEARRLLSTPETRQPWAFDGSGRRAAWRRPIFHRPPDRCRGGIFRWRSARTSRCCVSRATVCGPLPDICGPGAMYDLPRTPTQCRRRAPAPPTYRATTAQWHADRGWPAS